MKQVQQAYIVTARRTPVGKAPKGCFAHTRPDDLLAHVLKDVVQHTPGLDPAQIDDVVVGCAMPEAEQGLNVARIALLLAGLPQNVAGITVNRFCSSGLNAVAIAADRIRLGEADVMLAAGVESMSRLPMSGHRPSMNPEIFNDANIGIAYGMGITAEKVAERWQISREAQDAFALESHRRALAAQQAGWFDAEISPYLLENRRADLAKRLIELQCRHITVDEGPRSDTHLEALAKLKPAFAAQGSVTAGNSSQMSDGAAAVLLMSENALKRFNCSPMARFVTFSVAGVAPEVMGIGPVEAIPKALNLAGLRQDDLDWIELNEAFAAQSLAVINSLGLDPAKVNPQGGAIALGHPLGATGAIRIATLLHGLRRARGKFGMVTMCIGTGMGAAGIFEAL